ncbi:HAD family hydrolase [Rickettsia endosymbiont of Orchestes rusci]|uniref:hypothetical protein n=1 Tax=Rickettsia endosymbiont of Orchestes rusci TaxID=3066250 RepID=UPI00313E9131
MGKGKTELRATSELMVIEQDIVRDDDVVFCFDVDGTLVNGNSHNDVGNKLFRKYGNVAEKGRENEIRGYMQKFLANPIVGWKNKKETEELMSKIFEAGYKIALVTHNIFHVAIEYLVEQLELSAGDKSKIFVVLGDSGGSRQKQIEEVKKHFKIDKFQNMVLIDDNDDNIMVAQEAKMKVVIVNQYGKEYLEYAYKLLRSFLNPDDVSTEKVSSDNSSDEAMDISADFKNWNLSDNLSDGEYTPWLEDARPLGDIHH